jgi:hypothetical protein
MRSWASKELGQVRLSSTNIPAIERLMNSYECFKKFMDNPDQKKDLHIIYNLLAQPNIVSKRGLLLIILEVSIEETTVKKADKSEFKREIKFERIRCPPYPITEEQKQSNIGFMVHYTKVSRDKNAPEKRIFKDYAWEPLLYVDSISSAAGSRHRPKLWFQRSDEANWPPIVQKRVYEFFEQCSNRRGPFTSQYGFDPFSLIASQELIKGVDEIGIQPSGVIRDSYNHLVGIAYDPDDTNQMVSIPISDDGSMFDQQKIFFDWDDFKPAPADVVVKFYTTIFSSHFLAFAEGYKPRRLRTSDGKVVGVELQNRFVVPATEPLTQDGLDTLQESRAIDMFEWDNNKTIAYDAKMRKRAFESAGQKDPKNYIQLQASSIQDEIEDVYQHLRLSFSTWLTRPLPNGCGQERREKLETILRRHDMPLYEKRKQLDILLENVVTRWLEPGEEKTEIGFLRVDCLVQGQASCSGRCKWASRGEEDTSSCRIHTPTTVSPNGTIINVPRMLYLRLVDELIRFAYRREEIFAKRVPRLTIRQEAQRIGDQYIVPEGSPDWMTWWELLRSEWFESEIPRVFDEQFEPAPEV